MKTSLKYLAIGFMFFSISVYFSLENQGRHISFEIKLESKYANLLQEIFSLDNSNR
jgi:hypothetical protein